ncbi:MAG TPA: tetratricopeptide repeat protein [Thermoanaerobaculia bacterium]|nr:tetratricopeptide repeat protein [Thermoanaerobaculia bacterium]
MRHLTEEELAEYAFDPAAALNRAEIESHVEVCPECSALLTFIRSIDAEISDEQAWEISDAIGEVSRLNDTIRDLAAIVAEEDAEAERLLGPLMEKPAEFAWRNLAEQRKFRTGGVVRRLNRAANDACEREPLVALTLADAAIAVAESLDERAYPAQSVFDLRGMAWKERANALRLLGNYDAALEALDRAAREFRNAPLLPLGPAIVTHLRGIVCYERGDYDTALRYAQQSTREFEMCGDVDRYLKARHLEANIRFFQQDIREAQRIYGDILAHAEAIDDLSWIARESRTLGYCALELRDFSEAARHFHKALQAFEVLEQHAEIVRTNWGIACLQLASGKPSIALGRLNAVRSEFAKLGMVVDEALTVFDIMDALVALGREQEIATLADGLVERFTHAGMLNSALTALAYLRESAVRGKVTAPVIEYVRQFIRRVEREPSLLFVPPPPP